MDNKKSILLVNVYVLGIGGFVGRLKHTVQSVPLLTYTSIDRLQRSQDTKIYYPINSILLSTPITTSYSCTVCIIYST
jgi:hypothetical protein